MTQHTRFLALGLLALACHAYAGSAGVEVRATARAAYETEANLDDDAGGKANADDPAIWVHAQRPARSLVVATLKEGGLAVYSLTGSTLQRIAAPVSASEDDAPGRYNNVDIVEGFRLGRRSVDLAVVTDRGHDKLRIYRIDPDYDRSGQPPLVDVTDAAAPFVFNRTQAEVNDQATAYGLAVAVDAAGRAIGVVSQRERARVSTVEFLATAEGKVGYRVKDSFELPSSFTLPGGRSWTPCQDEDGVQPQVEGMVIDARTGTLYAAQEQVGIWQVSLREPSRRSLLDKVKTFGVPYEREYDADEEEYACTYLPSRENSRHAGRWLAADAEGLTILHGARGEASLFASSQGDSSFVVYDLRDGGEVAGSFRIAGGRKVDGSEHSDGAAVTGRYLGPDFPYGLLVVHDGENTPDALDGDGEKRENTNFKFVPLQRVLKLKD